MYAQSWQCSSICCSPGWTTRSTRAPEERWSSISSPLKLVARLTFESSNIRRAADAKFVVQVSKGWSVMRVGAAIALVEVLLASAGSGASLTDAAALYARNHVAESVK